MPFPTTDQRKEMQDNMKNALQLNGITLECSLVTKAFMFCDIAYELDAWADKVTITAYSANFPSSWNDHFSQVVDDITAAFQSRQQRRELYVWEGRLRPKRKRPQY